MAIVLGRKGGGSGGGGSQPTYESGGLYSGDSVVVTDGNETGELLTWDSLGSGVELLDRTDPERPTVLVEGIYAVTAVVAAEDLLTAGGSFRAVLHLDSSGEDAVCEMTVNAQSGGEHSQIAMVSLNTSYYIPSGGVIALTVILNDTATNRSFRLREAMIQRLS